MKKLLLVVALFLSLTPLAQASIKTFPVYATGSTTINVFSTGSTIYTSSFNMEDSSSYAVSLMATSGSSNNAPNVTISLEQSSTPPTIEAQSDSNWNTSSTTAVVSGYATKNTYFNATLTVAPLSYGRFKIAGNTGNSTDTTVKINLSRQYPV